MLTNASAPALASAGNAGVASQPATPILISLSAFGAAEVRRHGQLWFTQLSHDAGAEGVEVRSELLQDTASELPAIAREVRSAGKRVVYSSAEPLWRADGALDLAALERAFCAAGTLGAATLKMAMGGFGRAPDGTLSELQQRLQSGQIELLIENDQTAAAGSLVALQHLFAAADAHGLALGMTFDIGNWHWSGECPLLAATALAAKVRYVHCKGVQQQASRWVAVPLAQSSAPWRAVLRRLPPAVPWAIEYPLCGDDLSAVVQQEIGQLRGLAASFTTSPDPL